MSDDLIAKLQAGNQTSSTAKAEFSYDEVPYASLPFSQTHPSRLYSVGTLFGLRPTSVNKCRVLELGCASGGNLIPMADYLPDSEFVGVDLSSKQIAAGVELKNELKLDNLKLIHASITDIDASYGKFDYIICHGVFSWVPTPVRKRILEIYHELLTPNGIGYISYNTYPGWHMRGMIRDMMRYHAARFTSPAERVRQARALHDFLAQSVKQEGPYSQLLKLELENLRNQADHYLYHEHLEEVNDPLYFHEFVAQATEHELRYLGEARVSTMVTGNFGPEIEKTLRMIATDQIQAEQYMDFLRNRMFRESLVCHANQTPNWTVNVESLRSLHLCSGARPAPQEGQTEININDESPLMFRTPMGMNMTTTRPLLKHAMMLLQNAFPATIPFERLREIARANLGNIDGNPKQIAEDSQLLAMGFLNCYMSSDLVEFHGIPVTFHTTPTEKPVALHYARLMAEKAGIISNRRHDVIRLSEHDKRLIPLLDGQHDRNDLVKKMKEFAISGVLSVRKQEKQLTEPDEIHEALASIIDQALMNIAKMGILVA